MNPAGLRHAVTGFLVLCVGLLGVARVASAREGINRPSRVKVDAPLKAGLFPSVFEANAGQGPSDVLFASRARNYDLQLKAIEAVMHLAPGSTAESNQKGSPVKPLMRELRMGLEGANRRPGIRGVHKLQSHTNYLIGNQPNKWQTRIPNFKGVRYSEVYPGIDLLFKAGEQLEYDFVLSPRADPKAIALQFRGQEGLRIDSRGDLTVSTTAGTVRQKKPVLYQVVRGSRQPVKGEFVLLDDDSVGFKVGRYNRARPLTIDPIVTYSSYLGGGSDDEAQAVTVDDAGDVYLAGRTASTDFPPAVGTAPVQSTNRGAQDIFVAKFKADGSSLVYTTYLGGVDNDEAKGIAVDKSGSVYLTGTTGSDNFPRGTKTFRDTFVRRECINDTSPDGEVDIGQACTDAFFARLNADGSEMTYFTFLGGVDWDYGTAVDVDSKGHVYLTGTTFSSDFITTPGGAQPVSPDRAAPPCVASGGHALLCPSAYVVKIDPELSGLESLIFSTFLWGSRDDTGGDLEVDSSGSIYMVGTTNSNDFPTSGSAYSNTRSGEPEVRDVFVTQLSPDGSQRQYSSYFGGSGLEIGYGLSLGKAGQLWVTGITRSTDFPLEGDTPHQSSKGGGSDLFVMKVDPAQINKDSLQYSTYLGGPGEELESQIAADDCGSAHIALDDDRTVRLARFSESALAHLFSVGPTGSADVLDMGISLDPTSARNVYLVGSTQSDAFPMENALQPVRKGGLDAFLTRVTDEVDPCEADLSVTLLDTPAEVLAGQEIVHVAEVRNMGSKPVGAAQLTNTLTGVANPASVVASKGSCQWDAATLTCNLGELAPSAKETVTIRLATRVVGQVRLDSRIQGNLPDPNLANNVATRTTIVVKPGVLDLKTTPDPTPTPQVSSSLPPAPPAQGGLPTTTGVSNTLKPVLPAPPGGGGVPPGPAPAPVPAPFGNLSAAPTFVAEPGVSLGASISQGATFGGQENVAPQMGLAQAKEGYEPAPGHAMVGREDPAPGMLPGLQGWIGSLVAFAFLSSCCFFRGVGLKGDEEVPSPQIA